MYNNRQIAKKKMEISYRDELFRRDQIRQAHYRKLAEEKARRENQELEPLLIDLRQSPVLLFLLFLQPAFGNELDGFDLSGKAHPDN